MNGHDVEMIILRARMHARYTPPAIPIRRARIRRLRSASERGTATGPIAAVR